MNAADLNELLTREEPLCEELLGWVEPSPLGSGHCLKHPLVFVMLGLDLERAAMPNLQLAEKKRCLAKAEAEKNWHQAVFWHERPYRIDYFSKVASQMSDEDYWTVLSWVLQDTENQWQYLDLLKMLLISPDRVAERHLMMDEAERAVLKTLPDVIDIYRGCRWLNRNGLSWTLDKEKAIWFAKRFKHDKPYLHSGTVAKKDVIAYFDGRQEKEIVVLPHQVKNKQLEKLLTES